eukprot:2754100-Lingulodinium_polyedra.AAC.1
MGALWRARTPRGGPRTPELSGRTPAQIAPPDLILVPRHPSGNGLAVARCSSPDSRPSSVLHLPFG